MQQTPPAPTTLPQGLTPSSLTPSPLTDELRFAHLLALAGPEQATWLVAQLQRDLSGVKADLVRALTDTDAAGVRRATHSLMSLAGTIGAPGLHTQAMALNTAAHQDDAAALALVGAGVMTGLAALIADLAQRALPPMGQT